MQLHFTKMHGCGNDYIYLDCRETGLPAEIAVWSQKLSRRHFSIGADGIICICPPLTATPPCGCSTRMAPRAKCAATGCAVWRSFCTRTACRRM